MHKISKKMNGKSMLVEDDLSLPSPHPTPSSGSTSIRDSSHRDRRAMLDADYQSIVQHVAPTHVAFVSLNDHPHHHIESFTLSQQSHLPGDSFSEVEKLYIRNCNAMYSQGDSNEFNDDINNFDNVLRLRATSHAVVRRMQNHSDGRLLNDHVSLRE